MSATLRLSQYTASKVGDNTVSLLTALLDYAPTQEGHDNVANEIISCGNDYQLHQLHDRYLTGLIAPMRAAGGKTPPISEHPSRQSTELNETEPLNLIYSARDDQAQLKHLCLRRDNYRCVISGNVDYPSFKSGKISDLGESSMDVTVATHIIPFSIPARDERAASVERSSRISEILRKFGGIHLAELNGNKINRVENLLTLTFTNDMLWSYLDIWLETTPVEHKYRLRNAHSQGAKTPDGTIIHFHSNDPRVPLPDPRYIALHAACAKVFHASGAAKAVEKILLDYEEMKVLARDGSSADVLHFGLSMISVP